jgi:hypothetical protein
MTEESISFVIRARDKWLARLDPGSTTAPPAWMPDQACPEPVEGSGMTMLGTPPISSAPAPSP